MISINTAIQLKDAGLRWAPRLHDYFAIPYRNMDELLFVISDVQVTIEQLRGLQVVSFQGASEWALDYLVTSEAVWVPREDQLRQLLESALLRDGATEVRLTSGLNGSRVEIEDQDRRLEFNHSDASEAYAQALLAILQALNDVHPPARGADEANRQDER